MYARADEDCKYIEHYLEFDLSTLLRTYVIIPIYLPRSARGTLPGEADHDDHEEEVEVDVDVAGIAGCAIPADAVVIEDCDGDAIVAEGIATEDVHTRRAYADIMFVPDPCNGAAMRSMFCKQLESVGVRTWLNDRSDGSKINVDDDVADGDDYDKCIDSAAKEVLSQVEALRASGLHMRASARLCGLFSVVVPFAS